MCMTDELPDNVFDIVPTQSGSDSEYILMSEENALTYGFDNAGRVANGDRDERIALYSNGVSSLSVSVRKIDATAEELNGLLLETCTPFSSEELEA